MLGGAAAEDDGDAGAPAGVAVVGRAGRVVGAHRPRPYPLARHRRPVARRDGIRTVTAYPDAVTETRTPGRRPLAPATRVVALGREPRSSPAARSAPRWCSPRRTTPTATSTTAARATRPGRRSRTALGALEGGDALVLRLRAWRPSRRCCRCSRTAAPWSRPTHAYNGIAAPASPTARPRGRRTVRRVDVADTEAVLAALDGAALLWLESPTNPLLEVADLPTPARPPPASAARSSSSTTPSPRPCCSGRSSSAPTSSCTRPPSTSPATATCCSAPSSPPRRMPVAPARAAARRTARCTARSPGRWRPGSRCAGCAPCTCGSSGRRPTPSSSPRRLREPPGASSGCATRASAASSPIELAGGREARRAGLRGRPGCGCTPPASAASSPARAAPPHPERAGHGPREPGPALGRHRGRRRPLARPRPGPRPGLTASDAAAQAVSALRGRGQQRARRPPGRVRSCWITASTCSMIGTSTPLLRARSRIDAHDLTPSAVCLVTATTSATAMPLAEAAPRTCGCATAATCRWRPGRRARRARRRSAGRRRARCRAAPSRPARG